MREEQRTSTGTNFTSRKTKKEKLQSAIHKLQLDPKKAVANRKVIGKLIKQLEELEKKSV